MASHRLFPLLLATLLDLSQCKKSDADPTG